MLTTVDDLARPQKLNPIEARFSAAAQQYGQAAHVQKQIADALLDAFKDFAADFSPRKLLDVGCGTGFVTETLLKQHPNARVIAVDLAQGMLDQLQARLSNPRLELLRHDGQNLPASIVQGGADQAVLSSMCMQWFDKPADTLCHWAQFNRMVAVAVLLDGSFSAWRAAHAASCQPCGLHPLPSENTLQLALRALKARRPGLRVQSHTLEVQDHHPDGLSFARSLRAIGAHTPKPGHQPANLRKVLQQLGADCTLNYRVGIYLIENP